MDAFALEHAALEADVVSRHRHVLAVVGGHYHRSIQRAFAGTMAVCCPSTAVQLAPVFDHDLPTYQDEPPAMLLHLVDETGLRTHHVSLADTEQWVPSWALDVGE